MWAATGCPAERILDFLDLGCIANVYVRANVGAHHLNATTFTGPLTGVGNDIANGSDKGVHMVAILTIKTRLT